MGLRYALNVLYERYEKPVFIVENGYGAVDEKSSVRICDDTGRIDYLRAHIQDGFIYVDKYDDGSGTMERSRKNLLTGIKQPLSQTEKFFK